VTPNGRFVFASVRTTSVMAGFATDDAGLLTRVGSWTVGGSPRGFAVSPDSRFLLVGSQTLNAVELYRIEVNGSLDLVARYTTARNPSWIEILPTPSHG
jgi:6-phosphogluconolactonase